MALAELRRATRWAGLLLAAVLALPATAAPAVGSALQALLDAARPAPGQACTQAADKLARLLCKGRLRVGIRGDYPPFSSRVDGQPQGFEIDLARALASRLGIGVDFTSVTPANRIAALAEDRADLVIATMGHTTTRDAQALFVRPHYYQSRTVVVGRRGQALSGMADMMGRTVCVTLGNNTNAELAGHGARLLLFGGIQQLVDQLSQGSCALVAQDDSLFAHYFLQADFAARYEVKFGFSPVPWGAAVGRDGGERLAQALGVALRDMHQDGSLLQLARRHGIDTTVLEAEQLRFSAPPCLGATAPGDPRCVAAPHDNRLAPTAFAPAVASFETWLQQAAGMQLTLAMLKTQVALKLFLQGIGFSLALVGGAMAATMALALGFGAGLAAKSRWLRWPLRGLLMAMQSTPMVLLMIFAGVISSALGPSSAWTALAAAIAVLGLFNGSNAGQALAEAREEGGTLRQAVGRSRAQLVAFVVNATRGSPAASIIGVPELLSAQTDIASFSSDRLTTFTLLLLFYMAVVSVVVWLGQRWLASQAAPLATGAGRA